MENLKELIRKWRETADIWEQQLGPERPLRGTKWEDAPDKGRSGIKNWINWLRGCANKVEAAIAKDFQILSDSDASGSSSPGEEHRCFVTMTTATRDHYCMLPANHLGDHWNPCEKAQSVDAVDPVGEKVTG